MMFWNDSSWGVGAWVGMSLMMIVFWGGLIALTVWLVRSYRSDADKSPVQGATSHADELLAERFARGDIDEDEFQRRRSAIQSTRARP